MELLMQWLTSNRPQENTSKSDTDILQFQLQGDEIKHVRNVIVITCLFCKTELVAFRSRCSRVSRYLFTPHFQSHVQLTFLFKAAFDGTK